MDEEIIAALVEHHDAFKIQIKSITRRKERLIKELPLFKEHIEKEYMRIVMRIACSIVSKKTGDDYISIVEVLEPVIKEYLQ